MHINNVHVAFFISHVTFHIQYGMCAFGIWNVTIPTRDKFTLPQVYIGACPGGHRPGTADTMPACMHGTLQHHVRGRWDRLQACKPRWHAVRQGRDAPYAHAPGDVTAHTRNRTIPYKECNMRYKECNMHIIKCIYAYYIYITMH